MIRTRIDRPAQVYLRKLKGFLADVPADTRESILQDVQAHIEEATASGRETSEVLQALGEPKLLANASRSELELPQVAGRTWPDAGNLLGGISVALAVMAAVIVSFFLRSPEGKHPDSGSQPEPTVASLLELYGPGVALLTLIPAVLVLLVLFLPRRPRRWGLLAAAGGLSLLVFLDLFATGPFVVPAALTAWLAATVPYATKPVAGRAEQLTIRILGALLLIAPAVMFIPQLLMDGIRAEHSALLIWMVLSLALAIGYLINSKVAHWVVVLYGILILGTAVFEAEILIAAFWVGGGMVLALGLYGLLRLNPHRRSGARD